MILDYNQCQIPSDEIRIGGSNKVGFGFVEYDTLKTASLILPVPQDTVRTTVGDRCNAEWTLVGHTDLVAEAYKMDPNCRILADGTSEIDAVLEIVFGFGTTGCSVGHKIELRRGEVFIGNSDEPEIVFGEAFKDILITMSNCNDEVYIYETYESLSSLEIITGGGNDTIVIGNKNKGFESQVYPELIIDAGEGTDTLTINDSASEVAKVIELRPTSIDGGFHDSENKAIFYFGVEEMNLHLGTENDILTVNSTAESMFLNVTAGDGDDNVYVYGLQGDATVYGENDNDELYVDGRPDGIGRNKLDGTHLKWNGGIGKDYLEVELVSAGITDLTLFGDNVGENSAVVNCREVVCTVLSRQNFLANFNNTDDPNTSLERINTDLDTQSITSLLLDLFVDGENSVHFDGTMATMDVFGGPNNDHFYIGQMFRSPRNETYGVSIDDPINTTLTTKGYLSDGCDSSNPVTINGGPGNDTFDVLRNKCILDLNGESGDDSFVVRSFAAALEDGELKDPSLGKVNLTGLEGDDKFEVQQPEQEDAAAMGFDNPDYLVNSLVDVDGGTGTNRLTIVGTEFGDLYVIQDGKIFGGGLSIKFVNIAFLDVAGMEGDDNIVVLSSNPSTLLSLYGSLGSDTFILTPQEVEPVISKNLRGHRGIIEHEIVSSTDPEYNGMKVRGVQVDILDNDGNLGYISVVDQTRGFHLMEENGFGSFSFWVFPTRKPNAKVTVNIVPPAARDGNRYFKLNGKEVAEIFTWDQGEMEPKEVTVTYNPEVQPLNITEVNLMLKLSVDDAGGTTEDIRFINAEQSLLPIDITLIPSKTNADGAMSVTIDEKPDGTIVAEGQYGFSSSYDIYLRPCSSELRDVIEVTTVESVPNQLNLSTTNVTGKDFGNECKATVEVFAFDDSVSEGDHFVTIQHVVTNRSSGESIMLSDGSPLLAANLLVKIYDDDIAGVIIEETNAITATAEINDDDKGSIFNPSFYEDEFSVRLTKAPNGTVEVKLNSIAVATDYPSIFTPDNRDFTKRKQVNINDADTETLIFDHLNWNETVTVRVTAVNDVIEEGVNYLNFASQPSNLGLLQGPVKISGANSPFVPSLTDPVMLPVESNSGEFLIPTNVIIDTTMYLVDEAKQIDTVIFNNLNVRGELPSVGTLLKNQFLGMNMANNINVLQNGPFSGVVYEDIEVLVFNLGDGVDEITVENTSEAIHVMNLAEQSDIVTVKAISGPMIINGEEGEDEVLVSSNDVKLELIDALLAFDGGNDEDNDVLILDNSNDYDLDDVVNVTRLVVEVSSMEAPDFNKTSMVNSTSLKIPDDDEVEPSNITEKMANPILPRESYLINLRDSTGGTFTLVLNDTITKRILSATFSYDASAEIIQNELNSLLLPNSKSCGEDFTSYCSDACKVWELGNSNTFAIFFVGQRLNSGVGLSFYTNELIEFQEEIFNNMTNDILFKNSDVAYTNVDFLTIFMGHQDIVVNARGTSAETRIVTQEGWDKFFVGSDADENTTTASSVDVLYGVLDYIEGDLRLEANSGRHRLMMSDIFSLIPKGFGSVGYAELTRLSLESLADNLGNIYFTAMGGNWFDGVNLWLGDESDRLNVTSIPALPFNRTTTSVHAGNGSDILTINLIDSENVGSLFVANGQGGDDTLDASGSSHPVILFGDGGYDALLGGSSDDVLIGDYGLVKWINDDGQVVARSGGGGYNDFTDGIERSIHQIIAEYPELYQYSASGDNGLLSRSDVIIGNNARDVIIGCGGDNDTLYGNGDSDLMLGDYGVLEFDPAGPNLYGLHSIMSLNCAQGEGGGRNTLYGEGGDDILLGGADSDDYLEGNDGNDVGAGDCVSITFDQKYFIESITSVSAEIGGTDEMRMGSGDDIAIGGASDDKLYGDDGRDILVGDSAEMFFHSSILNRTGKPAEKGYFWNVPKSVTTISCEYSGNDTIFGGDGAVDYIIGGGNDDFIYGNAGPDLVIGDHGNILFYDDEEFGGDETAYKLLFATAIEANCTGGSDYIELGNGNDIAFGGAKGDIIEGNEGQDIILGDFGLYDAEEMFLPNQYFECLTLADYSKYAGSDTISGGDDDDFLLGQEFGDKIEGDDGADDITGGHNKRGGDDSGDTLHGGEGDDVILGDNGQILREVEGLETEYPWIVHVWVTYPAPFDTEPIRDLRRYDDIDLVQGDDFISGGPGNDILHGQRGDDEIHGGDGEDEVYGELGHDTIHGDEGNDILIGDIGYAMRRYSGEVPMTTSSGVWHKDIVLEELGNITAITRISEKVDVEAISAEDIGASSLMFVANAYKNDGKKYTDEGGRWLTDLILFDLEEEYDDVLDGGNGDDILIGQRGNDNISTGGGNDLAIGDAGTNKITATLDFPRVYQIYRSLESSISTGNGYALSSADFGFAFSSEFDLFPNPNRFIDSQSSFVDELIAFDDISTESNALRDILGISSIDTSYAYCMKPMFRIVPGFVSKTSALYGNDNISADAGKDFIIGDNIRGFSAFDLTEFHAIQDTRQELDDLAVDLSVRLSTLGYDTEHYLRYILNEPSSAGYNISVGCDNITTSEESTAFVTGDLLTVIGRTFLASYLTDPSVQVPHLLDRIRDVQQVITDLHFALYEIHLHLLKRALLATVDFKDGQTPSHSLLLADDIIFSKGNKDIVAGDASTLFVQIDSAADGFEFEVLKDNRLKAALSDIMDQRQDELDLHIENDLDPSEPIANQELSGLPFDDVPFYISFGNDIINMSTNENLVVGDFATVGISYSEDASSSSKADLRSLAKYTESINILRVKPSVSAFLPRLATYKIDYFYERYGQEVRKEVESFYHGDTFNARSEKNLVFGDFLSAATYGFASGDVLIDVKMNFYGIYENAEWAQFFSADTINSLSQTEAPRWISQKVNDNVNGNVEKLQKARAYSLIEEGMAAFFGEHDIAKQLVDDLFRYTTTTYTVSDDVSLRHVCNDAEPGFSYVPSHTLSVYIVDVEPENIVQPRLVESGGGSDPNSSAPPTSGPASKQPTPGPTEPSTDASQSCGDLTLARECKSPCLWSGKDKLCKDPEAANSSQSQRNHLRISIPTPAQSSLQSRDEWSSLQSRDE